jgi:hypothetical protein
VGGSYLMKDGHCTSVSGFHLAPRARTSISLLESSRPATQGMTGRVLTMPTDQKVRGSNLFGCAHLMSRRIADGCPGTSLHSAGLEWSAFDSAGLQVR